jgi:hypothetical protein
MTCQDINPYDGTVLRSRNWPSVGTGGNHDDQHARNRRPVLGRRRARDGKIAAAYRRCRPRVGQPGLRLGDRRVRAGEEQSLRMTGKALPRHVCDGHALPDFRLAKALLKNFRFETAIADAKELLTEKRCYSVATQRLRSRDTRRCKPPMGSNVVVTPNPRAHALFADKRNVHG